jgi:2-polyprenyl-6-hydroxyphenyl methylase / 3-demethylubiquinone-9 3-methyltransferase
MIDNEFYKNLGERWYSSTGDAVALLRLEGLAKTPWVLEQLRAIPAGGHVLDVGCGGGDLVLELSRRGYRATGVDRADSIVEVGRARDREKRAEWLTGDAMSLPLMSESQDAVCIMDVLEHVEDPGRVLEECARVLKPGGSLLFHTFNRTALSWLFAAKGLDWFLKDSPKHIHDWRMFIKPRELEDRLRVLGFHDFTFQGIGPVVSSKAFLALVFTGRVHEDFKFQLTDSLAVGYLGSAIKSRGD